MITEKKTKRTSQTLFCFCTGASDSSQLIHSPNGKHPLALYRLSNDLFVAFAQSNSGAVVMQACTQDRAGNV